MNIERAVAIIHINNIEHNYNLIKTIIPPQCQVMAVVKANAYGHGALEISKHLELQGVRHFAVTSINEAIELREGGINGEILILSHSNIQKTHLLCKYKLTQTVATLEYAKNLDSCNLPLNIHIKVDSGMSRIGFYCHGDEDIDSAFQEIKKVVNQPNLKVCGIYTHFAESDNDNSDFTEKQFSNFAKITEKVTSEGIDIGLRHCCNSAAILKYPHMHLDMVRPGIILYGLPPVKTSLYFKPVMELKSVIMQIKTLKPGDVVSYGRTYEAQAEIRIATIGIGYADGYFRQLSNKDSVLIKGRRVPIIGRICMDTCMIDVTDIDVSPGDEVTIFGEDGDLYKSVTEMADAIGTINYELLCAVSTRVEKIFQKL